MENRLHALQLAASVIGTVNGIDNLLPLAKEILEFIEEGSDD